MRAVTVPDFGLDNLIVAELADPAPEAGGVLIEAEAMTINPVDLMIVTGVVASSFPAGVKAPYTPGWDVAGRVVAVGEGVAGELVGRRVVGFSPWMDAGHGTQSTLVALPAQYVSVAPDGELTSARLTTVGLNGLTAWRAVDEVGARRGETVVVTGAAGSVGGYALQLLVADGARVIAAVSDRDRDLVLAMGASAVAAREDGDLGAAVRALTSGGADAVLDTASVGAAALGAIRDGGRYVTVTGVPDSERGIRVSRIIGVPDKPALDALVAMAVDGTLTPRVAREYAFDDAREAYREFAAGSHRGRIVLTL